jgi:glycerol-3-phosphate dehydrogenase
MPITVVVVAVVEGRMSAADAVDVLMRREAKSER